jgi:hypothetical protein
MAEFSKETINIGTGSNSGTGDTMRVSFTKTNNNFTELYNHTANLSANVETLQTDLEQYAGDLLILGGAAFDQANLAFDSSNNLILVAQTAIRTANDAANTANAAGIIANSAYNFANASFLNSANAHTKANGAFLVANAAYTKANTIDSVDADLQAAKSKYDRAYTKANDSYDLSSSTYVFAQGVAVNAEAAFTRTNTVYQYLNSSFSKINSAYTVINAAYTSVNAAYLVANAGYTTGNGAFRVVNAAFGVANAALPNVDSAVFNGRLYTANTLFGGTLQLSANGVYGTSNNWYGVYARSSNNHSLKAEATGNNDAIFTLAQRGNGVFGTANTGNGVVGFSEAGYGGYFYSANGVPLGSGYLKTADDGTLQIVDAVKVTSNGMLQFDSGFGYTANAYGVRAWVNFDGTSSVSSLSGLSFTANGTTKVIRVTISGQANNTPQYNDIVVDSTVVLLGTGNGTRTKHSDGSTSTFAAYLAIGNRQNTVGRAYKVTAIGNDWFEAYYDSPGYGYWSLWFFWWWWWYYIYGWYVPTGYRFQGTCTVVRSKIRGSGGVSSVNDLGNGKYQINFDFEMPDTNYCVTGTASSGDYFDDNWRSSSYLGVRTMHTSFVEVSSNHSWGGGGYWWWFWWIPTWTGPGTYPSKQMHVAIIR